MKSISTNDKKRLKTPKGQEEPDTLLSEWVTDCCLTPNELFSAMLLEEQVTLDEIMSALY